MEELHDQRTPYMKNRRVFLGLIVVVIGILLLANNFGFLPYYAKDIIISWQMILIVIGLVQIINHKEKPAGYILIAVGSFFLMPEIFNFPFSFMQLFWPTLLIVVGISLIFFHKSHHYPRAHRYSSKESFDSGFLDEINIFGGSKRKIINQEFKGGKITSIFGGAEIDLSQAELAEGTQIIEVTCVFGGMSLLVPPDWSVYVDVVSIFGAFEDKRTVIKKSNDTKRKLLVKGTAVFGGGDIKSF